MSRRTPSAPLSRRRCTRRPTPRSRASASPRVTPAASPRSAAAGPGLQVVLQGSPGSGRGRPCRRPGGRRHGPGQGVPGREHDRHRPDADARRRGGRGQDRCCSRRSATRPRLRLGQLRRQRGRAGGPVLRRQRRQRRRRGRPELLGSGLDHPDGPVWFQRLPLERTHGPLVRHVDGAPRRRRQLRQPDAAGQQRRAWPRASRSSRSSTRRTAWSSAPSPARGSSRRPRPRSGPSTRTRARTTSTARRTSPGSTPTGTSSSTRRWRPSRRSSSTTSTSVCSPTTSTSTSSSTSSATRSGWRTTTGPIPRSADRRSCVP